MKRIPVTYTVIFILCIQFGTFLLYTPCASSATTNQPQKLILGFEEAELSRGAYISRQEKPGRESWFYLLKRSEGFDFAARFEWPGETNRAWTWHCRPGAHTEGELALVATVAPINTEKQTATYTRTKFLSYFYPNIRRGLVEARPLMTSFQWLDKARPDLRDFSGYDLLWVDLHCDAGPVELWLALEDNILEPPVMRTFKIPAGKWVTVELDLKEASRVRDLDLTKISNFWLMAKSPIRTTLRIDNIRIVKHGVLAANKLLRDKSPLTVPVVRPKRPEVPKSPSTTKPDRTVIKLTKPVTVATGSIVPFGWVSAYDNRHIFVAYSARDKTNPEAKDEAKAIFTNDGGRSWKQLADPTARNLDHGTARGCAVDVTGDGIAVSSGPGCAGLGNPNPRQHLTKYTFTGKGWQARFPAILDSDIRHCGSNASVVRLPGGPFKGRLWASWGQIGREHAIDVHAKFSDDDGRTWLPWGKGAGIPDSQSAKWSDGTYGYPETVVCPHKEHVACFWRHKRRCGVKWSVFDGSDWSSPTQISPVTLDDMDGAYRATMSAVTKGHHEIFFTATGLNTILRWDGKSWHNESIRIEDGGMLSLAGDVVMLFTSGKVNRRWKGIRWQRRAILRCYQRRPNGRWEGPVNLTPEFNMDEYRSIAGFSVPPYAPENFVPLAFSDYNEGTVKLLKVPIPLKIHKKDK
ncbi:MAG: sialidase family protein [Planctomycetota bacterium]|jgi:hypothetical protein